VTSAAPLQRRLRSTIGAALARPSGVPRRARLVPAAAVLLGVLAVQFVLGLVAMAQAALTALALPWPVDFASTPVGAFLTTTLLVPAPFLVAAGAVLVLLPSGAATPLPTWLLRGLAAGGAGTVALAVVGAVQGSTSPFAAASPTFAVVSATTVPLTTGVRLTCVLLVSCTLVALASAARTTTGPGRPAAPTAGGEARPEAVAGTAQRVTGDHADGDHAGRDDVGGDDVGGDRTGGDHVTGHRDGVRPVRDPAPARGAEVGDLPAPAPVARSGADVPAGASPPAPRDHAPFLPPEDDR